MRASACIELIMRSLYRASFWSAWVQYYQLMAAQNDVLSTSEATNRGQLVSSSVEKAMRNALYLEVEVTAADRELWVHTSFDDGLDRVTI